jgi:demethylmenaquinone methyltransferase/2-methoxy-6-polyprenyl-1,4-benzoquinol methylase
MNVRDRLDPADVERMFDRIAGPYDLMNRLMTAGLDQRWRSIAARETGVGRGATVLDACSGTGDLALELARVVGRSGQVTGLDFSAEMLRRAERKSAGADAATVQWVRGDATAMPFADRSFAAATIAFGLRNLPDPEAGLRELARVVRPGGRVVILEITTPQRPPLSTFFSLWFDRLVPLIGKVAGDSDAYDYLPSSVKRFPQPEGLAASLERAGLVDIRWVLTAGGIIALHVGTKPGA